MGMFSRRSNKSAPKNDGLPFVRGRKVTVNHGRNNNNSRHGSLSKVEDNFEKFTQQNNSFECSNRGWWFAVGVVMAVNVCLYLSQTYSLIPTNKDKSNNVQAVPDIVDAALVRIPSLAAPEIASVPADDIVPVPVVPSAPTPPAPPATTCTAQQRELVLKQLANNCSRGRWSSECSFRVATGGCQNPILARTFFANMNDFNPVSSSLIQIPFMAVIVGWGNNDIPLDLLRIGSGLDPKYGKDWGALSTTGVNSKNICRAPITTTIAATKEGDQPTRLPPQVVVLDWENPTSSVLHELNEKYHEKELIIEDTINMNGEKDSLTTLIQSKLPTKVLHYLDLVGRSNGYDYTILMELLPELLQNVRFLHFEYNNKQKWSSRSYTLKDLITHLKTNGLICYWSGDEQTQYGLWRITDCFLDHYNNKHWSRIQCVSGIHSDVKELATRMETQFITTIQRKNSSFGG